MYFNTAQKTALIYFTEVKTLVIMERKHVNLAEQLFIS